MNAPAPFDALKKPDAPAPLSARVAAVSALSDPARRALFDLVSRSPGSVTRDAAAEAAGLSRSTTAFHLDRLAELGLLEVEYKRLSGRSGPGAGRPAKLYRRASTELSVSVPERHYDLAGDVLASAIELSAASGQPIHDALRTVAQAKGNQAGSRASSLPEALEQNGFEPVTDDDDLVFGNCPFHRLAQHHTAIVCALNYEFVNGLAAGAGDDAHTVVSDADAGRCCIRISPRTAGA
ncbi:helix-turn-helix transcriptional regulator [Leifsonia kafniensis]